MEELENYVLGETSEILEFDTRQINLQIAAYMAMQAKRSIRILSHNLEPEIYDNDTFISATRSLATRSRFSSIQILVLDSGFIIKHGHRLIELARKFTSFIQVNNPSAEHLDYTGAFILVDQCGFIQKTVADRNNGTASFNDPYSVKGLEKIFDEMWEKSSTDQELKRLHI